MRITNPVDYALVVPKIDAYLSRGLCAGLGKRDGQMCVEAAICAALDLPHGDNPGCVAPSVRQLKISLNDKNWSSPTARAKGLRDLAIAQLGSLGVVDDAKFLSIVSQKTIGVLIPDLFLKVFTKDTERHRLAVAAALRCEKDPTKGNINLARDAAYADAAAHAAADAAAYAHAAADAYAASDAAAAAAAAAAYAAAAYAAAAVKQGKDRPQDYYLRLCASFALGALQELKSPGCQYL